MLTGWKQITAYCGRSRRVILQLAREQQFPLLKIEGTWTTSRRLIDDWLRKRLEREEEGYENQR